MAAYGFGSPVSLGGEAVERPRIAVDIASEGSGITRTRVGVCAARLTRLAKEEHTNFILVICIYSSAKYYYVKLK